MNSEEMLQQQNGLEYITEFQKKIKTYHYSIDAQIQKNINEYVLKQKYSQWAFVGFLVFMLLMLVAIMRIMLKKIGEPLQELAIATEELSMGKAVVIPQHGDRKDELGMFSRSFDKMIRSIRENEQNLVAQNEELIAQQDELHSQKDELERAVEMIQLNEATLKQRNDLMNSLANSLDKQEVLDSIVKNICRVIYADCGIIALIDLNHEYASFGLAVTEEKQFIENLHSGMIMRLKETKKAFTIKRACTPMEKGYHNEELPCYDLYLPVVSSADQVIAVMMFTRYAHSFTNQEIEEYEGISKQIDISLEKIRLFDESEFDRLLTQDILNTIHEGVQLVDKNGVILQTNSKMAHLYATNPSMNIVNLPLEKWIDAVYPSIEEGEALMEFMKTVVFGKARLGKRYIYQITTPVKRVVQVYFEELHRGNEKFGTLFVHQDITKAYEVDQIKSEFVSTVSHELRTPLASVLGFTELMLNKELNQERQHKYLLTIYQEANRLTVLINDFLDVQRMESGKQTYEKKYEDIVPIIDQVIDTYRINHPNHTFLFTKNSDDTSVLGDHDKLIQVFNNLLSNAVKYSPDGGEIKVVLYKKENNLCVDVVDYGLGIPEDALSHLFTKFYRVDNSDRRKIGGTGLGLAIVNEIMKAHDGKVSVTSKIKKGSTFTLTMPMVLSKEMENKNVVVQGAPSTSTVHGVHVIVIEDDKNLASLLQTELEDNGFQVLQYMNGDAGMKAIEQYKPDAIVLDIMLGENGINGWGILERLKCEPELKDIPIIISSALEEKEKGYNLGASEYLIKPYQPHKLSSTILQILLKKEKQGQILVPCNINNGS